MHGGNNDFNYVLSLGALSIIVGFPVFIGILLFCVEIETLNSDTFK